MHNKEARTIYYLKWGNIGHANIGFCAVCLDLQVLATRSLPTQESQLSSLEVAKYWTCLVLCVICLASLALATRTLQAWEGQFGSLK